MYPVGKPGRFTKVETELNMYANEKSDKVIVPKKRLNKENKFSAEERTLPKRNTGQTTAVRTQSRDAASSGLAGVRQAARRRKDIQFTALLRKRQSLPSVIFSVLVIQ